MNQEELDQLAELEQLRELEAIRTAQAYAEAKASGAVEEQLAKDIPSGPMEKKLTADYEAIPSAIGSMVGGGVGMLGGVPGAITGAATGSAAMETLRQYVTNKLKKTPNKDLDKIRIAMSAVEGALAEAAPRVLGRIPIPYGSRVGIPTVGKAVSTVGEKIIEGGKNVLAKGSGILGGQGKEAALRTINRPSGVLSGNTEIDRKAAEAAELLLGQRRIEGTASKEAKKAFKEEFGSTPIDTGKVIGTAKEAVEHYAPSPEGFGPVDPKDLKKVTQLTTRGLTTPEVAPTPLPGAVSTRMEAEPGIQVLDPEIATQLYEQRWKHIKPSERVTLPPVMKEQVTLTKGTPGVMRDPVYGTPLSSKTVKTGPNPGDFRVEAVPDVPVFNVNREMVPEAPVTYSPLIQETVPVGGKQIIRPEAKGRKLTGNVISRMPTKSAKDVQSFVDTLDNLITAQGHRKAKESAKYNPRLTSVYSELRHKLKDQIHGLSTPLKDADAAFRLFTKDNELLAPLLKEGQRENMYNTLVKGPIEVTEKAAKRRLGPTMENVLDTRAARAYTAEGGNPAFFSLTPRTALRLAFGAGTGVGTSYLGMEPSTALALGAIAGGATYPGLHKQMLARGSQVMGPTLRGAITKLPTGAASYFLHGANPWSNLREGEEK